MPQAKQSVWRKMELLLNEMGSLSSGVGFLRLLFHLVGAYGKNTC